MNVQKPSTVDATYIKVKKVLQLGLFSSKSTHQVKIARANFFFMFFPSSSCF